MKPANNGILGDLTIFPFQGNFHLTQVLLNRDIRHSCILSLSLSLTFQYFPKGRDELYSICERKVLYQSNSRKENNIQHSSVFYVLASHFLISFNSFPLLEVMQSLIQPIFSDSDKFSSKGRFPLNPGFVQTGCSLYQQHSLEDFSVIMFRTRDIFL